MHRQPITNTVRFESIKLKSAIEIPSHFWCGISVCREISRSFLFFFPSSPSLILDIGVSVYVMHLPWIAVYNFRAAICAATRSSSACECISGAIFSCAPADEAGVFPSVSSAAIVRNSAALQREITSWERARWSLPLLLAPSLAIAVTYWNSRHTFRETYATIHVLNHVIISSEKFQTGKLHPRASLLSPRHKTSRHWDTRKRMCYIICWVMKRKICYLFRNNDAALCDTCYFHIRLEIEIEIGLGFYQLGKRKSISSLVKFALIKFRSNLNLDLWCGH